MKTRNVFLIMAIFFMLLSCICIFFYIFLFSLTAGCFAVLFLIISLYNFFHFVGHAGVDSIAGGFAAAVSMPNEKFKIPPERFSPIEAKIVSEDYDGAVKDLKEILEKNPGHPKAVAMLAELFAEKMSDYPKAYGLLSVYFEKKEEPSPGDEDLAMLFVDVLLEMKAADKAVEFLEKEMKKPYSKSVIKAFSTKKAAISPR